MKILGISAFYHNSSAALIIDGEIISAVEEERFTRLKNDSIFPYNSIVFCLKKSKITLNDLDSIIFYDNPNIKFDRFVKTMIAAVPFNYKYYKKHFFQWMNDKLFLEKKITNSLEKIDNNFKSSTTKLKFLKHHISHAASAYYPSNLKDAIIIVIDGVGEWETTTIMQAINGKIKPYKEIVFPDSLGLLYSTFTAYLGFKVNSGEYKVMGLAPYGKDKYSNLIKKEIIKLNEDGSFILNQKYFNYMHDDTEMYNSNFTSLFGHKKREENEEIGEFHIDIAKSIQVVLEEAIINICTNAHSELKINNLVLAGGVALNCVANSKIKELNLFEQIWIQPAAGDAGGAIGAALYDYYQVYSYKINKNKFDFMKGSLLGPEYTNDDAVNILKAYGATYHMKNESEIINDTSLLLANGNIVGWHQGPAEFGPRSLGNRSILGDPRSADMQEKLNIKIKFRESFRPFAPAVLEEDVEKYFSIKKSPYMLFTAEVKNRIEVKEKNGFMNNLKQLRSEIPAVTHVDYSARVQTVSKESNLKFHKLLKTFKSKTDCSVLINTSFNVRGEPIVLTPEDSFKTFMMTDMDVLVIENIILYKDEQKLSINFDKEKEKFIKNDTYKSDDKTKFKNEEDRSLHLREHTPSVKTYVQQKKNFFNISDQYIHKDYLFRTDKDGFICPSKIHNKADLNIVFIGGSTTECMFVDEEYRFPYLTGRILEDTTKKKINSINAGVSGNTSQHSLINLIGKVFALNNLDIIVMMHNQNDLFTLFIYGTYYEKKGERKIYKYNNIDEVKNPDDEWKEFRGKEISYDFERMKNLYSENLKMFIYMCKAKNITPVLMTMVSRSLKNSNNIEWLKKAYLPLEENYGLSVDKYFEMFDTFNDIIRITAKKHDILLIDLALEIDQNKELLYDTIHFNNAGSIQASNIIANKLKEII